MKEIPLEFSLDERNLGAAVDHLLEMIDGIVKRKKNSMGNNLSKNHLILHLPHYTSLWGPPTGMDSGDSKRNHKTQVKPQSKWTQRREDSFLGQFGQRWMETRLVSAAIARYQRINGEFGVVEDQPIVVAMGKEIILDGSHFEIGINEKNLPAMGWTDPKKRGHATHPQPVIDFLCHQVLPRIAGNTLHGRTEAKVMIGNE